MLPDWHRLYRRAEGTVNREQVQQSLIEEMSEMDIIDTHEHLPNESERVRQPVDFATLFSHYCKADLVSAGMTEADYARFTSAGLSPTEKWELFSVTMTSSPPAATAARLTSRWNGSRASRTSLQRPRRRH